MTDTDHWYDGAFFDRFIAPNQDDIFAAIRKAVRPGGTVLDVGCGTGRMAFQLAGHARLVHAIDPSIRNIRRAELVWKRRGSPGGIIFTHGSAADIRVVETEPYDHAVLSYVIHEVDERARVALLKTVAARSRRLILADYRVPRVRGWFNMLTEAVEFAAGPDHYRGFRSFVRNGGLNDLARASGLEVLEELPDGPRTTQILVLKGGA